MNEKLSLARKEKFWFVYGDGEPKGFLEERSALEYCRNRGWICVDKDDYGDFTLYTLIPE